LLRQKKRENDWAQKSILPSLRPGPAVLPVVVRSAPFCSFSVPHCEELLSWSKSHTMRVVSPTGNTREKKRY